MAQDSNVEKSFKKFDDLREEMRIALNNVSTSLGDSTSIIADAIRSKDDKTIANEVIKLDKIFRSYSSTYISKSYTRFVKEPAIKSINLLKQSEDPSTIAPWFLGKAAKFLKIEIKIIENIHYSLRELGSR